MLSDAFGERFGIEVPAGVFEALERGKVDSDEFTLLSPEEVLSLEFLSPVLPLRFLPLMLSHRGDLVGLYYPRLGGAPFAASFGIAESDLVALTADFEWLLALK